MVRKTGSTSPIIEADAYDGVLALVSEFVAGGTLKDGLINRGTGEFPVGQALEVAIGILTGLEYLHAQGIVHGDLKPANVLLQYGIPRLTDFGLAGSALAAASTGAIIGTPAYMSPEAFAGERSIRTDLWSVGIVLHEMLAGAPPFTQPSLTALMRDITDKSETPISARVSSLIAPVLKRMLDKDPARRFRSAADFRAALSDCRRLHADDMGKAAGPGFPHHLTISVTGSMAADARRVRQRLETLLAPYRSRLTTWYTGSNGMVDEVTAKYLAEAEQQVFLVGYASTDLSPPLAELARQHNFPFIDAEEEEVPDTPGAPTKRDQFFVTKSDLVILIWNGESSGTRELHDWLRRQHRDHLLVHV